MSTKKALRILFADDEEFTQVMMQELLTNADFVALSVGSVKDALIAVDEFQPHVVISDLHFGFGPNGAELLSRIAKEAPWIGLIVLTAHASPELAVSEAGEIPSNAIYLVKTELNSISTLVAAIHASLGKAEPISFRDSERDGLITISSTQAEVLRLIAAGYSNMAIAKVRNTSLRATESLVQRTFLALRINADTESNPRILATHLWQQGKVIIKRSE
jgi:DNA-binding NarL/FixJ family response regulator